MNERIFSLVYIIIGHRSNKIQSLLDIDDFFSFFSLIKKKIEKKNLVHMYDGKAQNVPQHGTKRLLNLCATGRH
jgi:hypothetical protein